jgi:hypothetical protein
MRTENERNKMATKISASKSKENKRGTPLWKFFFRFLHNADVRALAAMEALFGFLI